MSSHNEHNPYAPTYWSSDGLIGGASDSSEVPTLGVLAATFGGVIVSGAAFGMILGAIVSVATPVDVADVLVLLPLGLMAGAVIAGLSGTPTVLVSLCLSSPLVPLARGWQRHQARVFAGICGGVSGSLPVILIEPWNPAAWAIATVPGVFSAMGTVLFVRWVLPPWKRRHQLAGEHTLVERSGKNVT